MKIIIVVTLLILSSSVFAMSPDSLQCGEGRDSFLIETNYEGNWYYRAGNDSAIDLFMDNNLYYGEIKDIPADKGLYVGNRSSRLKFLFHSQDINSEGDGTVTLTEVVNHGDYNVREDVVCKAQRCASNGSWSCD